MSTVVDMESTFDKQGRIRKNYAEGETVISLPAMVFIVSDNFINTVCSCCLKVDKSREELQRCVQCGFVRYCSVDCQKRDWKGYHKDECQILKCVWKVCGAQCTDLVRLFVRSRLNINVSLKESKPKGQRLIPKSDATQCLTFSHKHDGCKKMFRAWTPLAQALDGHYNACLHQKGVLMKAINELTGGVMPLYSEKFDSEARFYDDAHSMIGYAHFDIPNTTASPSCKRNVVLLPTTKSDAGPALEIKAVVPLQAGEQLDFANARKLLGDPTILASKRICPVVCGYCDPSTQSYESSYTFATEHDMSDAELRNTYLTSYFNRLDQVTKLQLHRRAKTRYSITLRKGRRFFACNVVALPAFDRSPPQIFTDKNQAPSEGMEFLCWFCGAVMNGRELSGLVLPGAGMKLWKSIQESIHCRGDIDLLTKVMITQLEESARSLGPFVAPTSFPLGMYHRELADLYEQEGRMDQCVEAYKVVIPVIEKHLDKYDQNVFDGLSRLIVFHLERREIEEAVPYIDKAWARLHYIPGKDSTDCYVVDKLRTAVRTSRAFSFKEFCEVAPP